MKAETYDRVCRGAAFVRHNLGKRIHPDRIAEVCTWAGLVSYLIEREGLQCEMDELVNEFRAETRIREIWGVDT